MKQNPLLITEITRILCSFIDPKDLLNLALTCRVLHHESCFRLWNTLNPKSHRTLRKIKNTLETTEEYNKLVWKFCWSAREDAHHLERLFFDSFLFPNLRELEFSNAATQDHIVYPMIAASPYLRSLNLSQCYCLSTDAIRPLLTMPKHRLESLTLYGCGKIDPQVMADIIYRHSSTLKRIRLTDINDTILDAIQTCKRLNDLGLEHCSDTTLSNTALNRFFSAINQVQLTQLRLRDIDNLTSDHLRSISISKSGTSLLHLDMSECNRVKSDGVSFLATKCTSLNTLLLAYQTGVTNGAIQLFISNCHYLKHVDVSGCRLLTDHAFFPLLDGVIDDDIIPIILETLNVSGLDLLSAHSIHQLLTRLPRLQELSLGVTYDLDEADRILDAVNTDQLRFFIDIEKYYTICRMPTASLISLSKKRILILPNTTETTNNDTISLPSTSTWSLPPSIFQLE
ncbi:hypothetical protein MFLAVUS_002730 [Mucor flavus]|uniref:RNI-like protein n=1 Tax=Mucor flavus TaxID=439312 RepID=A0ABP9YR22_9FUNG